MKPIVRSIPVHATSANVNLVVSREDDKERLSLSIMADGRVVTSVTLDAMGWNDLLQCVALPPALPLKPLAQRSVKKRRTS